MVKKFLVSSIVALGIAHAGSLYSGFSIVPQAQYKFDNSTLKTKPLLGFNFGFVKDYKSGVIVGGKIETVYGKIKDSSDWTGSFDIDGHLGYRFYPSFNMPLDTYGIIGYRHSKIGDTGANGIGFGIGIALRKGWFRPVIEYTYFKMKVNSADFDDKRFTIGIDAAQF